MTLNGIDVSEHQGVCPGGHFVPAGQFGGAARGERR